MDAPPPSNDVGGGGEAVPLWVGGGGEAAVLAAAAAAAATAAAAAAATAAAIFGGGGGFPAAVNLLKHLLNNGVGPLDVLVVTSTSRRAADVRAFREFVRLLMEARDNGKPVREIVLRVDWVGFPDEPMKDLFQRALPGHPTLHRIEINIGTLPGAYLKMLTTSIPAAAAPAIQLLLLPPPAPSVKLRFGIGTRLREPIDQEKVDAIVAMLERNANVSELECGFFLDDDQCRCLCQALPNNTNLRFLHLRVEEVSGNALDGVATSSFTSLRIWGSVSSDAMSSLARQLRTNETLEHLMIIDSRANVVDHSPALLELVGTYNHTLRSVDGNHGVSHPDGQVAGQIQLRMRENARIRLALGQLRRPRPLQDVLLDMSSQIDYRWFDVLIENWDRYRNESALNLVALPDDRLPLLLEMVKDRPTALYRVLKIGYVNVLRERLGLQTDINNNNDDDDRRHP